MRSNADNNCGVSVYICKHVYVYVCMYINNFFTFFYKIFFPVISWFFCCCCISNQSLVSFLHFFSFECKRRIRLKIIFIYFAYFFFTWNVSQKRSKAHSPLPGPRLDWPVPAYSLVCNDSLRSVGWLHRRQLRWHGFKEDKTVASWWKMWFSGIWIIHVIVCVLLICFTNVIQTVNTQTRII